MNKKIEKDKKSDASSEELGAKAGDCACPPHTAPKGKTNHIGHPSGPTPGPTPILTPLKEPARPSRGASKGTCCLSLLPLPQPGPQQSLAWISCPASGQCLQIKGVKNPGQYQSWQALFKVPSCLHGLRCWGPPFYLLFREGGEGQPVSQGIRGNHRFLCRRPCSDWGLWIGRGQAHSVLPMTGCTWRQTSHRPSVALEQDVGPHPSPSFLPWSRMGQRGQCFPTFPRSPSPPLQTGPSDAHDLSGANASLI